MDHPAVDIERNIPTVVKYTAMPPSLMVWNCAHGDLLLPNLPADFPFEFTLPQDIPPTFTGLNYYKKTIQIAIKIM